MEISNEAASLLVEMALAQIANPNTAGSLPAHPYEVGKNYLVRTVTFLYTGRLVMVTAQELVLVDVAWIADTGLLSEALKNEEFSEVEPWADGRKVIIGRGAIVEASEITKLPRSQK